MSSQSKSLYEIPLNKFSYPAFTEESLQGQSKNRNSNSYQFSSVSSVSSTPELNNIKMKNKRRNCCMCCIQSKREKSRDSRFENIEENISNNRFAGLSKEARSEAIRKIFRRAIRKCMVQNAFAEARDLFRHSTRMTYGEEGLTRDKKGECLVMPGTKFNFIWTLIVLTLLLYTAIVTPFTVVFINHPPLSFFIWELFIDALFMIDIVVNFFTPYYSKGIIIKDKWLIAKKYLQSWFLIDVIACIPFNLFYTNDGAK